MIINYFTKFGAKVLYFSDTCNKKPQKVNFSAIFLSYLTSISEAVGLLTAERSNSLQAIQ